MEYVHPITSVLGLKCKWYKIIEIVDKGYEHSFVRLAGYPTKLYNLKNFKVK